jgi:hypothetical protein
MKSFIHIVIYSIFLNTFFFYSILGNTDIPDLLISDFKQVKTYKKESKDSKIKFQEVLKDIEYRFTEPEKINEINNNLDLELGYMFSSNEELNNIKVEFCKKSEMTGDGFFEIKIIPDAKNKSLKYKKSNILFFINTSASNTSDQLKEIGLGICNVLKDSQLYNKFNIVEFKNKPYPLFNSFKQPTDENLKTASHFLNNLKNTGPTNIQNSFSEYIKTLNVNKKQNLIVYLISDGQVKSNQLKKNIDFVKNITALNKNNMSIYAFSNSSKPNKLILNLLTNQNKGLSKTTEKASGSHELLTEYIINTNKQFLNNLTYKTSSNVLKYTYPKSLPNLYTNHPIYIYGYYKEGTKNISFKLSAVDNNNNKEKSYFFNFNIIKAKETDEKLSKKWAQQYIYYLYNLLVNDYSPELYEKILLVSSKFGIQIPYFATLNFEVQF